MAVDDDDDDAIDGPEPAALQLPDPLEVSLMDETLPTGVKVGLIVNTNPNHLCCQQICFISKFWPCCRRLRHSSSAAAPVGTWMFPDTICVEDDACVQNILQQSHM